MVEVIDLKQVEFQNASPDTTVVIPVFDKNTREVPVQGETVDTFYERKIVPLNTPIVGRSVKTNKDFVLSGAVKTDASVTTVGNTTDETNLNTYTFGKNALHIGATIRLFASGVYTNTDGTSTMTLRVGLGTAPTTALNTIVSTAAAVTNAPWNLTWYGIVTLIGSAGTIETALTGNINSVQKDNSNTAAQTINTTIEEMLALTADWSAADAGNSFKIRQFVVEVLY